MPLGIIQPSGDTQPPGTEYLLDTEQTSASHPYEHAHLKHLGGKETGIVLVPQPSDDPNDPLLWPRWKKEVTFAVLFYNCIVFATTPGPLIAASTLALSGILGVTLTKVSELSGYQLLVVGALGPIVSVLAQKYGKRPQFLFASTMGVIGTGICIAGAVQTNYNTLLAGRIVQGFGVTAYESLSVAAIGDIFYLHERGHRTALLVLTLACMAAMVAIITGPIFENLGWRFLFWILLPFDLLGWLGTVFLLPETQFRRRVIDTSPVARDSEGHEKVIQNEQMEEVRNTPEGSVTRRTVVQDMRPFSGTYTPDNIFKLFAEIFIHLLNPAVLWILSVSAVLVAFFVVTAYILAQTFSVPPYNLTVAQNGFLFTGAFIGGVLGVSAGWMCDVTARRMSLANRGVFEAEFRIPINILSFVLLAVGWFVFMWEVDHPSHNGIYLASFCHGLICYGVSITSTSGGLYILDSFRGYSTEIFILQMMVKNFIFYSFSTFINSWAAEKGAGEVFKVFGIVTLTGLLSCIPMYCFGKVNRTFMHGLWAKYLAKSSAA